MPLPGDLGFSPDLASAWITGLLDAALRGTLLLLVAGAAARLLRDAPAAARHAVWALALAGLLLTPVLQPVLPGLEAPFVPEIRLPAGPGAEPAAAAGPSVPTPEAAAPGAPPAVGDASNPAGAVPADAEPGALAAAADRVASWGAGGVLALVWLVGFLAVMGSLAVAKLRVWWLARDARRIRDGPWTELRDELAGRLGLRRSVVLLRSPRPLVPMTWGIGRPRVLLPAAADDWPRACRRNVLLHELAHVKRRDLLVRHLARLACALYWFHPLVWMAARRLRLEQEEACDDHVLRAGALASDYARHLVGLARVLKGVRSAARAGSTGGGRTDFARRMRALLSPGRERGALSGRWLTAAAAAAAALVTGLAALVPATAGTAGETDAAGAPALADGTAVAGPGGGPAGMELPSIRVDRPAPSGDRESAGPSAGDTPDPSGVPGAGDDPDAGPGGAQETAAGQDDVTASPAADRGAGPSGAGEPARGDTEARAETAGGEAGPPRTVGALAGGIGEPVFEALAPSLVARWHGAPSPETEPTGSADGGPDAASAPDAGVRSGSGGVGDAARRLVERLDVATDPDRRGELLRDAARDGATRTMAVLVEVSFRAVRHDDRVRAVRTLAQEAPREVGGRFLYQVARTNPWPGVRAEAIHQLRRLRPEQVVTWLVHLAYHDEERAVQRRAVGALARLGGGAESSLTQIARSHPDAEVRIAAIYWLVRTGSGSSLAKYVQAA